MSSFLFFFQTNIHCMFTKRKLGCDEKNTPADNFSRSPKKGSSQKRDVTITLDRTRHQARPFPLVISRLVIESGGSSK